MWAYWFIFSSFSNKFFKHIGMFNFVPFFSQGFRCISEYCEIFRKLNCLLVCFWSFWLAVLSFLKKLVEREKKENWQDVPIAQMPERSLQCIMFKKLRLELFWNLWFAFFWFFEIYGQMLGRNGIFCRERIICGNNFCVFFVCMICIIVIRKNEDFIEYVNYWIIFSNLQENYL